MTEQDLEKQFIERFKDIGWNYVSGAGLERENLDSVLLERILIKSIENVNSDKNFTPEDVIRRVNDLKMLPSTEEGVKHTLEIIKYGVKVEDKKERILKDMKFIDFENPKANSFIVTNQPVYKSGDKEIRNDIILYVNGIPLVNIELKTPDSYRKSWIDGYEDIKKYEKTVPELYKYVQIGISSDLQTKYFPIVPWEEDVSVYSWKKIEADAEDDGIFNIMEMLRPETLLDIIRYYLFIREERGKKTKVIARYMQYRAVEKMVDRVMGRMRGHHDDSHGLVWHWQGSGKTLTMIFAANKLFQMRDTANPSIFFIVDRDELEEQLFDNFAELDLFGTIEKITSIEKLREILSHDGYKGKRGIFITLIHKFSPAQLNEFNVEMKKLKEEAEKRGSINLTIAGRKNVICFIDEAPRTQYGLLAAQMGEVFKNGNTFAFTGTPIAQKDRNTYVKYGSGKELYLDKYFMADSIKDGYTKKIAYQPRLADEVHIGAELREVFYDQEDVDELSPEEMEKINKKVREKLNEINVVLEHPDKIRLVAKDLSEHFKNNVNGKFKAVLIAASRKACAMYKEELDKYFLPDETEIVISMGPKERDPKIAAQFDRITRKYNEKDLSIIKKKITDKFKESPDISPKILIVTEMLIAGFDAPVLQTIYLHKALKNHRLLQAIARTNRPYREKEAGLVIDYAGVLDDIKSAFKAYDEKDREDVLYDFEKLAAMFEKVIKECAGLFKEKLDYRDFSTPYLIARMKYLSSVDRRQAEFEEKYREVRRLYEMLGSSNIKLKYIDEFKWLSALYGYLKKAFGGDETAGYVRKYFKRTLENIYQAVEIKNLKDLPGVVYDDKLIGKLTSGEAGEEKAASIVFSLRKYVLVEKAKNPIYEALAERVRRLIREWQENIKKYEDIIKEGVEILKETKQVESRQKELGMDNIEYAIYLRLLSEKLEHSEAMESLKEIKNAINEQGGFMLDYISNPEIKKIISQTVRRIFRRKYKYPPEKLDSLTENMVNDIMGVKEYGSDKDK